MLFRSEDTQCGLAGRHLGMQQHALKRIEIVRDSTGFDHAPAITFETLHDVVGAGKRGGAVDRDPVVVEDTHQAIESEMSGE